LDSAPLPDVPATVQRFQELGVPFPSCNVYLFGLPDIVCDLLLLVGFAKRSSVTRAAARGVPGREFNTSARNASNDLRRTGPESDKAYVERFAMKARQKGEDLQSYFSVCERAIR
jgi:hypothetical protein